MLVNVSQPANALIRAGRPPDTGVLLFGPRFVSSLQSICLVLHRFIFSL